MLLWVGSKGFKLKSTEDDDKKKEDIKRVNSGNEYMPHSKVINDKKTSIISSSNDMSMNAMDSFKEYMKKLHMSAANCSSTSLT